MSFQFLHHSPILTTAGIKLENRSQSITPMLVHLPVRHVEIEITKTKNVPEQDPGYILTLAVESVGRMTTESQTVPIMAHLTVELDQKGHIPGPGLVLIHQPPPMTGFCKKQRTPKGKATEDLHQELKTLDKVILGEDLEVAQ